MERYITDLLGSLQEICTNNLGFSFLHQKRIQKLEFSELNKQLFALWFWRHLPVYCSLFLDHFLSVVITSLLSRGNHCSQLPQPVLSMFCSQLQLKPVPNSLHRNLILLPLMKWSLNEASRAGGLKQREPSPGSKSRNDIWWKKQSVWTVSKLVIRSTRWSQISTICLDIVPEWVVHNTVCYYREILYTFVACCRSKFQTI